MYIDNDNDNNNDKTPAAQGNVYGDDIMPSLRPCGCDRAVIYVILYHSISYYIIDSTVWHSTVS